MAQTSGMEQPETPQVETKSRLLIVIGEQHSDLQKKHILDDLQSGIKSWNNTLSGCNIYDELQEASSNFQIGEEGPNAERSLQYNSENVNIEILVNPQLRVLSNRMKQFFTSGGSYHHLIYSGMIIQSSGSWVLQDSLYHISNLADLFRSAEVTNAIKQGVVKGHVFINSNTETEWTENLLSKFSTSLNFSLNATPVHEAGSLDNFLKVLPQYFQIKSINDLLKASNVVGNIRFTRPTLYVFPSCQGDSSLFGISGFNLLIDAGYSRRSAFWDFARHLDRIDALFLTHLGPHNLFGISSVIARKFEENLHPEIGCVFLNAISDLSKIVYSDNSSSLLNVASECTKLVDRMKQLGLGARPCLGNVVNGNVQSTNLYHKVGHGSLDMFVLNPMQDSKCLKEFLTAWSKGSNAFSSKTGLPLCNVASVCTLLVWRPSSFTDTITRLLFPGSVTQEILFEGLDRLKNMNLFHHHQCCEKDLIISKIPSARKIPVKSSVLPRTAKSLSIPGVVNSPRSEISSPRSEHSSKEKKTWPSKREPVKESIDIKKSQSKPKKQADVQKADEEFVIESDDKFAKEKVSGDSRIEVHGVPSPSAGNQSETSPIQPIPAKEVSDDISIQNSTTDALVLKTEQDGDLARHDSLENVDAPPISEIAVQNPVVPSESKSENTFDAKTLQEGLQGEANPFFGIDGDEKEADEKTEEKFEVENLKEHPMSLPPPVRVASKLSPSSNIPPKRIGLQMNQTGEKKVQESEKPRFPSLQRKPDTKVMRDIKRPSAGTSRGSLKSFVPIYVDLSYVPNHGDPRYVDIEFFKRVRARYYVFSTINPEAGVLTALLEAKQTWEDPDLEVTIIPTYDAEVLRYWLAAHHDQLSQLKINVAPAANRCTIQLQDHETSCAAYRLEF